MLDQPITVGSLIVLNGIWYLPIVILLGKAVWYLSKITHQHDQMWEWYSHDRRQGARRGRTTEPA